jgi:hypothetical protein
MVGFDDASEKMRTLDGNSVQTINSNLTAETDITQARRLAGTDELWAYGSQQKARFDIGESLAVTMLSSPNAAGCCNSDVIRPSFNASQFLRRNKVTWVIDFGLEKHLEKVARYEEPFKFCETEIKPGRVGHREPIQRNQWWLHARPSPSYRKFASVAEKLLVTPAVSKHRVFSFVNPVWVPDHALIVFSRGDEMFFGILQSRIHEIWSRAQATQVRERESGLRYTPKVCFETFPFPFLEDLEEAPDNTGAWLDAAKHYKHIVLHEKSTPYDAGKSEIPNPKSAEEHRAAIAAAAEELNELRERWLNPPEWTVEKILEFPGTKDGPWLRYLDAKTVNAKTRVGRVRYPRLEPRDAECAAKLKKRTLTNLYNERPAWLDLAHQKLDAAVAAAYGWPADLSEEQILEKLLALNLERAAAEAKAAKTSNPGPQREKATDEMV